MQRWTTVQVPWSGEYNDTKFEFTIPESSRAVIALSQLDDRYFVGLQGQYSFELAFRLHKSKEEKHLIRGYSSGSRSAATELDLEAGVYEVLLQISATRDTNEPKLEDVVKANWLERRSKLIQVSLAYDLAQAMGQIDLGKKEKDDSATKRSPDKGSAAPKG